MKSTASLLLLTLLAGSASVSAVRADPADDAISAAMKLSIATNYSWTTKISVNSRNLEIDGKTSVEGYSTLTFIGYAGTPSATKSSSTSSSSSSDSASGTNTVFSGDSKYVIQSGTGWTTPSPVSSSSSDESSNNKNNNTTTTRRGGSVRGGQRGSSGSGNQSASNASASPRLPVGINLPHEELSIIASNYSEMHVDKDGVVNGKLADFGADQLLVPPATAQTPPEGSAGTFKLWITDGTVTKYEVTLSAEKAPPGISSKGKFTETITVEISDVGATKVDVPIAAKQKLGGV